MKWTLEPRERAVYARYARLALPRHTSYPSVPVWDQRFSAAALRGHLAPLARDGAPVSVYVHVPFCERLCYFCACTREIVPPARRQRERPVRDYLDHLRREVDLYRRLRRTWSVAQLHFGGGSPTFLEPAELEELVGILREVFVLLPDAEFAVEIDPRHTTSAHLRTLAAAGVNRLSLGIQDFDVRVQTLVNRVQPYQLVRDVVAECRGLGFAALNFDLIYGLPAQTPGTMARTLEQVLALRPDRIAFYRLAVIPEMFRWQNRFAAEDLPDSDTLLELFLLAGATLTAAGYEFIGLDHFALPEEALARAYRHGTLRRNFQGMSTGAGLPILGLGPSAISQLPVCYAQNHKTSAEWALHLTQGWPIVRGIELDREDRARREVLQHLYCYGRVDLSQVAAAFGFEAETLFADEIARLDELVGDGLIDRDGNQWRLTEPLGRLLVRVVAAVFDRYLPPLAYRQGLPPHMASRVG
ncbi:MAG: oxygen-independent coproporphyrinogen III oxidase [Gemmataceae bacterium]